MNGTIVAAADLDRVIGLDNALPWKLPADLQRFKALTTGHAVVMGRKTFESMKRPLKNRRNIVVSRDLSYRADGCEVMALEQALAVPDPMIIGGAEIYAKALPLCQRVVLTIVMHRFRGDTWFPPLSREWGVQSRENFAADDANPWGTSVFTLVRSSELEPFVWPAAA